jgi:hypothetical protein
MGDGRDTRGGAYDPVSKEGNPQPHQVKEQQPRRGQPQPGADVRSEPAPGEDEPYPAPEGLRRPPTGPLDRNVGRRVNTRR